MTTIWAIEEGQYSDYHIVGVFSTKEAAELIHGIVGGDEPVEWILDPAVDEVRQGLALYLVFMLRDGTMETVEQRAVDSYNLRQEPYELWFRSQTYWGQREGLKDCLRGYVWARDPEEAVKATNEHRVQLIANGEWE